MSESPAALTLTNYADVQAALKHPGLVQSLYDEGEQVMRDALITLHGDAHRQRRVLEFGVFTRGFFRDYEQRVFPALLTPVLDRHLAAGEVDLVAFGYEVTMNLTAYFAGIDRGDEGTTDQSSAESDALLALVKKFSEGATLVHSTRDRAEVRAEVSAAMQTFEQRFLLPSRNRRLELIKAWEQGDVDESELPRDVMTTLLKNRANYPMADDVFCREIAFYLQAGAHSTANATVHAVHEIFGWRESQGLTWDALTADPLLVQRCVHESLRLYPASPVAWRRAETDLQLTLATGECHVAKDQKLVLDLAAANRDVQVFGASAAAFEPGRKLPNGVWPFGLSFGYGVHACLGRDLDGGLPARASRPADNHQYGIVALLVSRLLGLGIRPHPQQAPIADPSTIRSAWSSYPLVFTDKNYPQTGTR